jgi:hypothetical protein
MSVWGHAGAGSPSSKVACISFLRPLFGTYLVFRLRFFCFRRRRRRLCLRPCPRSMEALDCAPDAPGRRSRSPSPDAALRPSPTTPVCGTGWEQSAVTPSTDAYNALAEQASCKACESASKRLKHTCTKAKHTAGNSSTNSLERGGGVRARAHACVALGRCVAFGRPKMSVWGHAGARSRTPKVACISFLRALFWNLFDGSVSIFLFETPTASPLSAIPRTCPRSARQRACRRPERCDVRAHRRRARRCARSRRRASPSPRPSHDF